MKGSGNEGRILNEQLARAARIRMPSVVVVKKGLNLNNGSYPNSGSSTNSMDDYTPDNTKFKMKHTPRKRLTNDIINARNSFMKSSINSNKYRKEKNSDISHFLKDKAVEKRLKTKLVNDSSFYIKYNTTV